MPVTRLSVLLVTAIIVTCTSSVALAGVFQGAGPGSADIQGAIDLFRLDIGGANNGVGGSFTTGRREINWDGGGATALIILDPSPPGMTRFLTRGPLFTTPPPGFALEISGGGTPPGDVAEFAEINATYPGIFQTFSSPRLFSPRGNNITEISFFLPTDSTVPASTRAFGAVFTDVDETDSTKIEYFGLNNVLLDSQFVLPANQGLSFLGVTFPTAQVFGVRITSGDTPLGPNDGGGTDIVVMDDFIFGEPQRVPEPSAMVLVGAGLVALGCLAWSRRSPS